MGKKGFDLDKIDKILSQFPDEDVGGSGQEAPPKPALKAGKPSATTKSEAPRHPEKPQSPIGAWIRVSAGAVLAIAITQWPYGNACGLGLFLYLAAIVGVLVVGVWAARYTWQTQLVAPHLVALGVVLWGSAIGLFQVLPRVGYAKAEASWICGITAADPQADADPVASPATQPQAGVALTDSIAQADTVDMADSIAVGDSPALLDSVSPADSLPRAGPDTSGSDP